MRPRPGVGHAPESFSADVHPGAWEVADDAVDPDCDGAGLSWAVDAIAEATCGCASQGGRPTGLLGALVLAGVSRRRRAAPRALPDSSSGSARTPAGT